MSHIGSGCNDPVAYPNLTSQSINNPFHLFNEANVPNYTNPGVAPPDPTPSAATNLSLQTTATATSAPTATASNDRGGGHQGSKRPQNHSVGGGTASGISTAFNIVKGIMGVGILTVPWSLSQIGIAPALVLLSLSFLLSLACWVLLCLLCSFYGVFSYRDLGLIVFGRRFATFLDVLLLLFLYLVCILYVVFLTDFVVDGLSTFGVAVTDDLTLSSLPSIGSLPLSEVAGSRLFIAAVAVFGVLFPLSLLRRLDSLKYSSFLGIVGVLYTVGLVLFTFFDDGDRSGRAVAASVRWVRWHGDGDTVWFWLSSFSVFVAAFNSHYNAPALFGEMRGRSPSKFIRIASASFLFLLATNAAIGMAGYFVAGDGAAQNVLDSLPQTLSVGIARLIMAVTITGTYPLLFWNVKESLDNLLMLRSVVRLHSKIKKVPRKYSCFCTKFTVYLAVTASILVAAVSVEDVAVCIAFMQSLIGNAIVFVFPSLFFLQMVRHRKHSGAQLAAATVLCYVVILFGAVCVFGGSIAAVLFWTGYIR